MRVFHFLLLQREHFASFVVESLDGCDAELPLEAGASVVLVFYWNDPCVGFAETGGDYVNHCAGAACKESKLICYYNWSGAVGKVIQLWFVYRRVTFLHLKSYI